MRRAIAFTACALLFGQAHAQQSATEGPSEDGVIAQALGAAPPQIRENATVVDLQGNVLREGTGAYTCMPAPDGFAGPMCLDAQWLAWLDDLMAEKPTGTSKLGIAYMLAGDTPTGGASNIDPAARTPTADNDWVIEGPHVMILLPDEALLSDLPTTPVEDGPYVMWSGTPYAHVMLPVGERPPQRPVSSQ